MAFAGAFLWLFEYETRYAVLTSCDQNRLTFMKTVVAAILLCVGVSFGWSQDSKPPVNYAVIGLAHDHANGFLPRAQNRPEVQLAGIVEPNPDLVARYSRALNLPTNLFAPSLEALLARTNIQAVATFTSTFQHREVVEKCAARGIHVMMEKPLAVSLADGRAMAAAAKKGGIHVIVNYETTWYLGNQEAYAMVHDQHAIGDLRKIVVHDGHRGPKEIGCSPAFLEWLTDPVLNGGGALTDFGCYGADLATWLMDGQRPSAVVAVTQQIKPEVYPKVDDEATILLTYPHAQAIIQASWNWPFDRKDMEVYGRTGYVLVPQRDLLRVRKAGAPETELKLSPPSAPNPMTDEIAYFAAVVRGEVQPTGLSSLEVNLIVTEILDAARQSARTGKRIELPSSPPW
jgi:scyllo-inositol 2-dehydrogenase (NADP+)